MSDTPDRLLDARELAELLHVTPRWIRSHTGPADGIPHFRLGKFPRYRLDRVLAWLEEQEQGGGRSQRLRRVS
jgi:hypothetical protein